MYDIYMETSQVKELNIGSKKKGKRKTPLSKQYHAFLQGKSSRLQR